MTRTLNIWWDERLVGQLAQNQHGELGFAYAPEWLNDEKALPLSASLSCRGAIEGAGGSGGWSSGIACAGPAQIVGPGFDQTAIETFAEMILDRAERCELTVVD